MVLVISFLIVFWAHRSIHLAIFYTFNIRLNVFYISWHRHPRICSYPSILGSNEYICLLLLRLFLRFICLVSVLAILLIASDLAGIAMQHINLLYHYFAGIYSKVS
jgi:hypothetical protein